MFSTIIIAYNAYGNIVIADGSTQNGDELSVAKIDWTCVYQYIGLFN